jgi:hypothetical protein
MPAARGPKHEAMDYVGVSGFFANVRRFSAAQVVQENSCRTVNLFTRSLPK